MHLNSIQALHWYHEICEEVYDSSDYFANLGIMRIKLMYLSKSSIKFYCELGNQCE